MEECFAGRIECPDCGEVEMGVQLQRPLTESEAKSTRAFLLVLHRQWNHGERRPGAAVILSNRNDKAKDPGILRGGISTAQDDSARKATVRAQEQS